MRAFLFLALLAPIMAFQVEINHSPAMNHLQSKQAKIMEDQIIAILECIREVLKTGDAETGFPSFDPLEVSELNIDIDSLELQGLEGFVSIKNLKVNGIPAWDLEQLKISITIIPIGAKIVAKVSWPSGDLECDYQVNASLFDHTFTGAGHVEGNLSDLHFELEAQAAINPISIKSAKVVALLSSAKLVIPGLTMDGVDISGGIAELVALAPTLLAENQELINTLITDVVLPLLNDILANIGNSDARFLGYDIPIIGHCLTLGRV